MSEKESKGWLMDLTPEELTERRKKGEPGILIEFNFDEHGRAILSLAVQDENNSEPVWAHMAIVDAIRFIAGLAQEVGKVACESQARLSERAATDPAAFAALLDLMLMGEEIHDQLDEAIEDEDQAAVEFWAKKNFS